MGKTFKKSSSGGGHKKGKGSSSSSHTHAADKLKRHQLRKAHKARNDASETSKLRAQLAALQLGWRDIPGDGNCLFHAIADQVFGLVVEGSSSSTTTPYHQIVRKLCVKEMETNPDDYAPFLLDQEDDTEEDVVDLTEYLLAMKEEGTWGGNVELQAISKALHIDIAIHQVDLPPWLILNFSSSSNSREGICDKKEVRLVHIAYQGGQHYDSVRNLDDMVGIGPATPINLGTVLGNSSSSGSSSSTSSTSSSSSLSSSSSSFPTLPCEKTLVAAFPNIHTRPSESRMKQALLDCDYDVDAAVELLLIGGGGGDDDGDDGDIASTVVTTTTTTTKAAVSAEKSTTRSDNNEQVQKEPIITTTTSSSSSATTTLASTNGEIVSPQSSHEGVNVNVSVSVSVVVDNDDGVKKKSKKSDINNNKETVSGPRRNGPCPCGSYKVYRKCCENVDRAKKAKQKACGGNSTSNNHADGEEVNGLSLSLGGVCI